MKAKETDIKPGRILYYVACVDAFDTLNAKLTNKVIVTAPVKEVRLSSHYAKMFACIDDYRPYGLDWCNHGAHHFLADVGLDCDDNPRYGKSMVRTTSALMTLQLTEG